jgi:cytochrome c556
MKQDERKEIQDCIHKEIWSAFNDFSLELREYITSTIEALKANTEVSTDAVRKLDQIIHKLDKR